MDRVDICWNQEAGELRQSGIRYVLMRPDVVMGVLRHLPEPEQYVAAMVASAHEYSRASFDQYAQSGATSDVDAIEHGCRMAGQLGWGHWTLRKTVGMPAAVQVENSPFAIAAKPSSIPTCGWIAGVLTALFESAQGKGFIAIETQCTAQGHSHCEFEFTARE